MALIDITIEVDEGVRSFRAAIDDTPVELDDGKGRIEVEDEPDHQAQIAFVGPAGSKLRYRIEYAGVLLAKGTAEIWSESEPYGLLRQQFNLPIRDAS